MIVNADIVRKNVRKVEICVDDGRLQVVAPFDMDGATLRDILRKNASWFKQKIDCSSKAATVDVGQTYFGNVDLASDLFAFKKVVIVGQIFDVVAGDINKAILDGNKVVVSERLFNDGAKRKNAVTCLIKSLAKQCIRQEISQFGTSIALCPSAINVTTLKGDGWIRCKDMQNRVVSIDYRVIQLPFELRNYLVAHLFSHFFQPGHDKEFFEVLSNYLPNYAILQKELEKYYFLKEIV